MGPTQSWASQCEEGALGRDMQEKRGHWRQEISLCEGTEVWEGRVRCLREQSEEGPKGRSGQLRSLHPKGLGGEWPWDPHYGQHDAKGNQAEEARVRVLPAPALPHPRALKLMSRQLLSH